MAVLGTPSDCRDALSLERPISTHSGHDVRPLGRVDQRCQKPDDYAAIVGIVRTWVGLISN